MPLEHSGNHSAHTVPSAEPGVILEEVVTLGQSPGSGRGEQACGSGVPGLYIISPSLRREPVASESMVDHPGCCCLCSCFYHRALCPLLLEEEEDSISCGEPR